MTWIMRLGSWRAAWLELGLGFWLAAGCVSDPVVEDDVPAPEGAVQPESTSSRVVSAIEACDTLMAAEDETRQRLACALPDARPDCPAYLRVAGALPCDDVREDTVEACVAIVGGYTACSDFDTRPCIVTVEEASCREPAPPATGGSGGMGTVDGSAGLGGGGAGGFGPDAGMVTGGSGGAPLADSGTDSGALGGADGAVPRDAAADGDILDAPAD